MRLNSSLTEVHVHRSFVWLRNALLGAMVRARNAKQKRVLDLAVSGFSVIDVDICEMLPRCVDKRRPP